MPGTPGKKIRYVLDGEGRRVGKKVNDVMTERYLYRDRYRLAAVQDGAGNLKWRFVYATDRHVPDYATDAEGNRYRLVTDQLGSLRLVVKEDGTIVQRMSHDAWGVIEDEWTASGVHPVPIGFAGGLHDTDTRLVHFGAREYDPERGRWTRKDPIRFAGGSANIYGYASQDPINAFDPNGENPWLLAGAVLSGAAALSVYLDLFWLPADDAEETGLPDPVDGPQDAYRHCLASCVAAGHFGLVIAELAEDVYGEDDSPSGCMDRKNNAVGRNLGEETDDTVNDCRRRCRSALSRGDLQTRP